jgi:hypothetical protein
MATSKTYRDIETRVDGQGREMEISVQREARRSARFIEGVVVGEM